MQYREVDLWQPGAPADARLLAYGHDGRPVLVFPTEGGPPHQFADNGMVDAVRGLVDAGRVTIYCVGSADGESWGADRLPLEDRARRHDGYRAWVVDRVAPAVVDDCGGRSDVAVAGCSLGAFHALNSTFQRADLFPLALCFSGNYDPAHWRGWGSRGDSFYVNDPHSHIGGADGDHLAWLRERVSVLLVVGQGMWEDTTGALESTRRLAGLLAAKGIRHELDVWGHDVPHDWPSWRSQWAHHLPRFC